MSWMFDPNASREENRRAMIRAGRKSSLRRTLDAPGTERRRALERVDYARANGMPRSADVWRTLADDAVPAHLRYLLDDDDED